MFIFKFARCRNAARVALAAPLDVHATADSVGQSSASIALTAAGTAAAKAGHISATTAAAE